MIKVMTVKTINNGILNYLYNGVKGQIKPGNYQLGVDFPEEAALFLAEMYSNNVKIVEGNFIENLNKENKEYKNIEQKLEEKEKNVYNLDKKKNKK